MNSPKRKAQPLKKNYPVQCPKSASKIKFIDNQFSLSHNLIKILSKIIAEKDFKPLFKIAK